jgi:hypothetical protein
MAAQASQEKDPRHHTQKMQRRLQETMDHLREDVKKVDEPQLKAMFEKGGRSPGRSQEGVQRLRTKERTGLEALTLRATR